MALDVIDFGEQQEERLDDRANTLFGDIGRPLSATAETVAGANGPRSIALASGLQVSDVLRGDRKGAPQGRLGQNADMLAFWPTDDRPEYGIVCIENATNVPGVQRIDLRGPDKGDVETILTGTRACDGIRRTPWNTILVTEEVGGAVAPATPVAAGRALEIYDPIETTGVTLDRESGTVSGVDAANVKVRSALGRFAWEGIAIYDDGTLYAGDELRPEEGKNGGAIFKFVPDQKPADGSGPDLSDPANADASPFARGKLYALRLDAGGENYGQGNERGLGSWQGPIDPAIARVEGQEKGTGFWRPEDMHPDPIALARDEVRFCWTNTGEADAGNYGEVLCADDRPVAGAPTGSTPEVQQFVAGNPFMNQPDNLEFQPKTGIVYVIEDSPTVNGEGKPGDIWACLRDGADRDGQSDGCVLVASVKTEGAEPTGFIFRGDGKKAYVNIQHSPDDPATPNTDESTYDEMLEIDGFEPGKARATKGTSTFDPTPPAETPAP